MQMVTVSPKYQVVIPKKIRVSLQLRPGQKMQVVEYDGRVELIPEKDIKEPFQVLVPEFLSNPNYYQRRSI
jgi:AbrB family looped-hinge helix DNA binding protein